MKGNGWNILYVDYPHTSRSGVGNRAKINLIFERLFDRSPDILALKDGVVMLVEVDSNFSTSYHEKFTEYENGRSTLTKELEGVIKEKIQKVVFGFSFTSKVIMPSTKLALEKEYVIFYLNEAGFIKSDNCP